MVEHSSLMNRQHRGALNLLYLQLSHVTGNLLRDRSVANFAEYEATKHKVNNWYLEESRELFIKCRAKDIDASESSTIYHHQIHKKLIKQSSLLKLDTPDGMKLGHHECRQYMEKMMTELLRPVNLDPTAQNLLLDETPEVFNEEDRIFFSKEPSTEETKESVWRSNLTGSPGKDGIISLFYKVHWDLVGTPA